VLPQPDSFKTPSTLIVVFILDAFISGAAVGICAEAVVLSAPTIKSVLRYFIGPVRIYSQKRTVLFSCTELLDKARVYVTLTEITLQVLFAAVKCRS
jgi:hypothetical protein